MPVCCWQGLHTTSHHHWRACASKAVDELTCLHEVYVHGEISKGIAEVGTISGRLCECLWHRRGITL